MSAYNFGEIEKKWQQKWVESGLYRVDNNSSKPKYYVLDMFPYPSGAGLHVGHPLGYIASDIVARFKRLHGYNVLHPMGYDAFGLPAEQYAIQTGQHPAVTTANNIATFRRQLDIMGFSYDWSREVRTCDPAYYQWTQWIFGQFFTHWYDRNADKARPVYELIQHFSLHGTEGLNAACPESLQFTATEWNVLSPKMKDEVLNNYRLAFINETTVNWCEELGTVLANEEVVNGVSERGGYPVVRKKMKQWALRITAYADRLLEGLNRIDWTDSIKEIQRNWIGRSEGAQIQFAIENLPSSIEVFTTRPDTIFGATFMVLAPEYEGLAGLCSEGQREAVMAYAGKARNRSEIDRMADTTKTGVYTGVNCINPFTGKPIPVWVSDYVLAGYGTGAIMAVPAHDERDFEFAAAFHLPVVPVIKPAGEELEMPLKEAFSAKDGICFNSGFLDGLPVREAIQRAIHEAEHKHLGKRKINYKLREAGFGRQRYWGEPFPIIYNTDGIPLLAEELPVELPKVESYKPTGTGESPLAAVKDWVEADLDKIPTFNEVVIPSSQQPDKEAESTGTVHNPGRRETDTMPGWAGSSWYFLRYMDPHNAEAFASPEALQYWKQVDLYVGGAEHATGHLLYSRFWTKFLYDLDYLSFDEPFQKLVNQGMIGGEDGQKMSKRWGNVVNPDDVIAAHGADTLRLYEMFLGPLTDSKPWNTHGIEGVSRFLGKFWRLFYVDDQWAVTDENPTDAELKILHKTIKKVTWDIENMSFNTSVSAFMVATNELGQLKCHKRQILKKLLIVLAPFAPHITEELWHKLGNTDSIHKAAWPAHEEKYLVENSFSYPISINGKTRTNIEFPLDMDAAEIEKAVMADETVQRWMEGKPLKKFILVKGRIVNVVV
ncbi:MAG: leucine--tRNA ligase [Bacteroidetes bacterium]|nr:leucine--tRNA ligase [Bacteroidota bacterium]